MSAQDHAVWGACVSATLPLVCVSTRPSHLPGCALRALMPYNLTKIARGMLAYSQSSESPGCSRGKPCGKHALNCTRCRMYNVVNVRSQASEYIITLIWRPSDYQSRTIFGFFKPMRLIVVIGEDARSREGAGMTGDNGPESIRPEPLHRLGF